MIEEEIHDPDQYINPPIPSRTDTIYTKYNQMRESGLVHEDDQIVFVDNPNPRNYPKQANHSRFAVMINCEKCKKLAMTQISYEHGLASFLWCFLLTPALCAGMCCLCLNSCKDVKHLCGNCHSQVGICKSSIC